MFAVVASPSAFTAAPQLAANARAAPAIAMPAVTIAVPGALMEPLALPLTEPAVLQGLLAEPMLRRRLATPDPGLAPWWFFPHMDFENCVL